MKLSEHFTGLFNDSFRAGPRVFTVKSIDLNRGDPKPVMGFHETSQRLVLNLTRMRDLQTAFGTDDTDAMIGKRVEVFLGEFTMNGMTRETIRIRLPGQDGSPNQ